MNIGHTLRPGNSLQPLADMIDTHVMNDGGPAFPVHGGHPGDDPRNKILGGGMSLRDWFAGQALPQAVEDYGQPMMGAGGQQRRNHGNPVLPYSAAAIGTREEIIARQAYRYADAMLAARERVKPATPKPPRERWAVGQHLRDTKEEAEAFLAQLREERPSLFDGWEVIHVREVIE